MSEQYLNPFISQSLASIRSWGTMMGGSGGGGDFPYYEELGRETLESPSATISVTGLEAKDNLLILVFPIIDTTLPLPALQFNGVSTGNEYASIDSRDGGSDIPFVSQNQLYLCDVGGYENDIFSVTYVSNVEDQDKIVISNAVRRLSAGASNAPSTSEIVGKWVNTDQITRVDLFNGNTGDWDTGSQVIVLGYNNTNTSTASNYWEELASVDLSSGASGTLSSGVITAKDYYWIQGYIDTSTGATSRKLIMGTTTVDPDNNYARRRSDDGGTWTPSTISSRILSLSDAETVQPFYFSAFICNKAGHEKLMIAFGNDITGTGSSNAPSRVSAVGKWDVTSGQADIFSILADANMGTETRMTIWGSD